MIRTTCIAIFSAMAFTACGGSDTSPATVQIKDETILSAPLETLIPWDSEREEVQTTPSGLQYVVLSSGDASGDMPGINDSTAVHYEGRLAETGEKFDSSYDRGSPATFGVTQVIAGWTEALQLMRPGDDWVVYLPSDIAYGQNPRPGGIIKPGDDLVFRMNLIETIKDETPGSEVFDANLPWNADKSGVVTTDYGAQYIVLEAGDESAPVLGISDKVKQNFEIRKASDGRRLDSTFANGNPQTMDVSSLIPGWSQTLQLMRPGDDWLVYFPAGAFGLPEGRQAGPIGAQDEILMRINVQDVVIPEVSDAAAWEKYTPWNSDSPDVLKADNGIEYVVLESGAPDGNSPTPSNSVEVYYEGRLTTGETFDSAYARGESIEFGVTRVISGWTETLQRMRPGDRWLVYIPSEKAYGQNPPPGAPIKAGDDLIFEMQLLSIR